MIILGIETSCDETAVSIVEAGGNLENLNFRILGSALHSQIEIHAPYGGVYPTLAKREHIKNLPIVYKQALTNAKIGESKIDIIAVTVGPGLEPALWTGINFAKALGDKLSVPIVGINHMEGHIASVLFETEVNFESETPNTQQIQNRKSENLNKNKQKIKFPAIALLISGGHTELIYLKNWIEIEKIGETKDDAVGEAFDKVARMLGLSYPGGPKISALAEEARNKNIGLEIKFPRPMIHSGDLDFSFSGLKTAVLYYIREITRPKSFSYNNKKVTSEEPPSFVVREGGLGDELSDSQKMAIAREFEDAVIETLVLKTKAAIEKHNPKTLIIGGGVIANKALRENFLNFKNNRDSLDVLIPEKSLTTDNAVMIAAAGFIEYLKNSRSNEKELVADGNLSIK